MNPATPPGLQDILLELQSSHINRQNLACESDSSRFSIKQCRSQEAHCTPIIHGRSRDVEWETRDRLIHQDAEVVAEIGARDAQGPGAGKDKGVAGSEEGVSEEREVERGVVGLGVESGFVPVAKAWLAREVEEEEGMERMLSAEMRRFDSQIITEQTEREDCQGQGIASPEGVAIEKPSEKLVVVLCEG